MKGIILMAYGTPRTLGDVEPYYTDIRGGRKPSPSELANLVGRYEAIGGTSPLIQITERQRDKLQARLRRAGSETRVFAAMKHSPPFIKDVLAQAADAGVDEILALVLAPHYSKMSTGTYMLALDLANAALPNKVKLSYVWSWHTNPLLIQAWARRIERARLGLREGHSLIFSAHSLPEKILAQGDPYRSQLLETSELIAAEAGYKEWSFSFQSASHTGEPWMGPDILDHLQSQFQSGRREFLIAPIGFVSDHLEILYDIDVECRQWAKDRGATLVRCESLNDSEDLIECLHSIAIEKGFL